MGLALMAEVLSVDQILFSDRQSYGDTKPETLVTHAYDYRRWRIAQIIEKLGFSLCFWV